MFSSAASTSSCDLSPRRYLATTTFTTSPKQPSPLVIDAISSLSQTIVAQFDETEKNADANTPLLITKTPATLAPTINHHLASTTSNRLSVGEQRTSKEIDEDEKGRITRTKSTPPCIDLSKCNVGIPRLELSGKKSLI